MKGRSPQVRIAGVPIAVLAAVGVVGTAVGVGLTPAPARAACPTSNSSYNSQRTGTLSNVGPYAVRWRVSGITDAPCSKVVFTDASSPNSDCLEVLYDWDVDQVDHYDARIFITCHQSFTKDRVHSEALSNEPSAPYTAIVAMRAVRVCRRVGGQSGSRTGCVNPLANASFNPPTNIGSQFADFWVWNSQGNSVVIYDNDPP
jgi:hypothetical protein